MEKLLKTKGLDMNIIFYIQSFMLPKKEYNQVIRQLKDGDIYHLCTTNMVYVRDTNKTFIKYNKKFKEGDIIFWKGHVGLCLDKKKFIHAYGPRKKVLVMPTDLTIKLIKKTAKLIVKKISNIISFI